MTIEDIFEKHLLNKHDVQKAGRVAEKDREELNKDINISNDSISTVRNTNVDDYAIFKSLVAQATHLRNQYQFIMKAEWIITTREKVEAYYDKLSVSEASDDYFKELDFALTMKDRRTPEDAQALFGISPEEWDKRVSTNPVSFRSDVRKIVEQKVNILSDDILNMQTLTYNDKLRMRKRYEGDVDDFFKKIIEDAFMDLDSIFPNKTTRSPQLQRVFDMKNMFMQIATDILSISELYATGWDMELELSRGEESVYKSIYNKRVSEQAELRRVQLSKSLEEAKKSELEATNNAISERSRLLDIQIKTKEANIKSLNMIGKTDMFSSPVQQTTQPVPPATRGWEESNTSEVVTNMSGEEDDEDEE